MKKILFLALLAGKSLSAQMHISTDKVLSKKATKFDQKALETLKKSTTYFFYKEEEYPYIDKLKAAMDSTWTISKELVFIPYEEKSLDSLAKENCSILIIAPTLYYTAVGVRIRSVNLELYMIDGVNRIDFAKVVLQSAFSTLANQPTSGNLNTYLYEEGIFRNWYPTYLKNVMQNINYYISTSQTRWTFLNQTSDELSQLSKTTLYVPEYALIDFDAKTGDENGRHDVKELMKDYPFKYEVISPEDLHNLDISSNDSLFYLSCSRSVSDIFICVIEAKTGKIFYSYYKSLSYNISSKDLKDIASAVAKTIKK